VLEGRKIKLYRLENVAMEITYIQIEVAKLFLFSIHVENANSISNEDLLDKVEIYTYSTYIYEE
jgi:tmRNA-binding protein